MRPSTRALICSFLLAACDGTPDAIAPQMEPGPPLRAISDATFQGGADHFYFLPPIVRQPRYEGEFVGSWGTRVAACTWTGDACVGAPVVVLEGDAVVVQDRQERYWAQWRTEGSDLVVGSTYRVGVEVTSASPVPQPMGFADVVVIERTADEDAVPSGGAVPLVLGETLPIRFRIEDGAVDTEGPVASGLELDPEPGFVGEPLPLTATLEDAFGSDVVGAQVSLDGGSTWYPMDPADGSFDSAVESVRADGPVVGEPGEKTVCVRGTDQWGLIGAPACEPFEFVIPCVPQDMGSGGAGFDLTLAKVLVGLQQGHGEDDDPGQPDRFDGMSWVYRGDGTRNADVSNCWSQWDRRDIVTPGGWGGLDADTEAFVGRNWETGDLVVSFRGTEPELADLFTDINAIPVEWGSKPGFYHLGFVNAYASVQEQLIRSLANEIARTDLGGRAPFSGRVFFIGHSLGGALATLAALDLADRLDDYIDEAVMYSFAAPRSMSHDAAAAYASKVPKAWAVAHQEDPIPSAPGPLLWSHIPNMVVVNSMQLTGETPTHPARIDFWDGSEFRLCQRLGGINTHVLDRYFARLFGVRATRPRRGYLETSWLGTMIVRWAVADDIVPGPCDWVAIFPTEPTNPLLHLPGTRRGVMNPNLDELPIPYPMVPGYWAGYVDGRGVIVAKEEYEVPRVQLEYNGTWVCIIALCPTGDKSQWYWEWASSSTVSVKWWPPSDIGPTDFVALFTQDPATAGASGYVWGSARLAILPPFLHVQLLTFEPKYWVAYISQEGTDASTRRILATAGPVCRHPDTCSTSR